MLADYPFNPIHLLWGIPLFIVFWFVLPCFLIYCGYKAVKARRRGQTLPKGLIVAVWLSLFLGGIFIWATVLFTFAHSDESAQAACINNLRQIDGAKQTWALENHKNSNDVPSWDDIRPYFGKGNEHSLPACPKGGVYVIGKVGEAPKCSIGGYGHSLD